MPTKGMGEEILRLNRNERAPFSGALVPEDTFRKMMMDPELLDIYKKELVECQKNASDSQYSVLPLITLGVGLLGGFLLNTHR